MSFKEPTDGRATNLDQGPQASYSRAEDLAVTYCIYEQVYSLSQKHNLVKLLVNPKSVASSLHDPQNSQTILQRQGNN
jgi:hypothetical protein